MPGWRCCGAGEVAMPLHRLRRSPSPNKFGEEQSSPPHSSNGEGDRRRRWRGWLAGFAKKTGRGAAKPRRRSCSVGFRPTASPAGLGRVCPQRFRVAGSRPATSVSRVLSCAQRHTDGHSSRTAVARRLQQPTRMTGPVPALRVAPRAIPIRSCSRWGLPCRSGCPSRGALLPHRFTLACPPVCTRAIGGLFSVALSLAPPQITLEARPPGVTRHRVPWSPDFPRQDRS